MHGINQFKTGSLRSFVPALHFDQSRAFYTEIGFTETYHKDNLCIFSVNGQSFYLQDYYVKEWAENFMMMLEVSELEQLEILLKEKDLTKKYQLFRLNQIKKEDWGSVLHMIDPSGVLWHFCRFND